MVLYTDCLRMVNRLEEVERLPLFLDAIAESVPSVMAVTFNLNLAIEEALVNVINYAYPADGAEHPILLEVSATQDSDTEAVELVFSLSDQGTPFDPTAAPDADITLSAEERPIGGLGIFLVRQIMDNVCYKYENSSNILVMSKSI